MQSRDHCPIRDLWEASPTPISPCDIPIFGWRVDLIILLFCTAVFAGNSPAAEAMHQTAANVMIELPLAAQCDHDDPFNTVTLDVIFTDPSGRELRVPAFWAGGKNWKVRYASPLGRHPSLPQRMLRRERRRSARRHRRSGDQAVHGRQPAL